MKKENIIKSRSFNFALEVIRLYKKLVEEKEYVISKQLLKSSTSIGANIEEAMAAQSRRDFLSKISIASKEARETNYWLRLLSESGLTEIDLSPLISESAELVKILTSIVLTTKQKTSG